MTPRAIVGAISGVAIVEEPDVAGEICDYASTRRLLEPRFAQGGVALKAMHRADEVGRLTGLTFDDDRRRIRIRAEIHCEAAWLKVLGREYVGLSAGGHYVARWSCPHTGLRRYTADIAEISLVDTPCAPSARLRPHF